MDNRTGAFFSGVANTVREPMTYAEALTLYGLGNEVRAKQVLANGSSLWPDWYNQYANRLSDAHPTANLAGSIAGGALGGVSLLRAAPRRDDIIHKGIFNKYHGDFNSINQYGRRVSKPTAATIGGGVAGIHESIEGHLND